MSDKIVVFDAAGQVMEKGTSLVEASAGTGKTYAIGMLVLRGVVELGLPIEKILIVTFTKAATEELKERIRARLAEARTLLHFLEGAEDSSLAGQFDETLLAWGRAVRDVALAQKRLQLALLDIDRAPIFTIHGFCQRMLVDQALESGQLFNVELLTGIDHIVSQVVDDFWRNEIYNLDPLPCSLLMSAFAAPETLLQTVSACFKSLAPIEPAPIDKKEVVLRLELAKENLQEWWLENRSTLYDAFTEAIAAKCFNKGLYAGFEAWFDKVSRFIDGNGAPLPEELIYLTYDGLLGQLNGSKLRGDAKKQAYLCGWSLPSHEVETFLRCRDELVLAFRLGLAGRRRQVGERLLEQGAMGFDGLIQNLALGLEGEKGAELCRVIGEKYSLALIDEFQDTDDLQYRIFSRLFGGGSHYLYLIGDPKQAIYKFRGADIHSYFAAKNGAATLLTLEKNYRSHPNLVAEVNRLFGGRPRPFDYDEEKLGYNPVVSGLSADSFDVIECGQSLAGMVYCTLPENEDDKAGRWTSGKAADQFCAFTAVEICSLLSSGRDLGYTKHGKARPLAPRDIAILVRSNKQAETYRERLALAGVPAVVGSRDSVFHTPECLELITLLKSAEAPTDLSALKAAMAISWFNFSGNELKEIWDDDGQLSGWQAKFIRYHNHWLEQGLFYMVNHFLRDEKIFQSIAVQPFAERKIANISQLTELSQEAESEGNYGMGQLLSWLQRMYAEEKPESGAELLLESDEDAVQIVTMHGAKGLEYPIVFCPYLWYATDHFDRENNQVSVHENGANLIDLGSPLFDERKLLARAEARAENLRLLYVALTRAKVRCYTMWADVKQYATVMDSFKSPLGYLLFPEGYVDHDVQQSHFAELAEKNTLTHILVDMSSGPASYQKVEADSLLQPLRPSERSLHTDWQMSSFSALAKLSDYEYDHSAPAVRTTGEESVAVPGLPAGPNFGNVIHDLLEKNPFQSLAGPERAVPEIQQNIARNCIRYGVEAAEENIAMLLSNVVSAPLPAGFSLAEIPDGQCLKEMAFYFQLQPFRTEAIYDILKGDPAVLPVGQRKMRGYLTGFVDLICEWQGRYYIMDYKTNNLGNNLDAYSALALTSAMQSHNYGLQYWIYALVLHRHLQNLVDGYRYDRDFGGVMYLFVRGMTPKLPGHGVYSVVPDYATLEKLGSLLGGTGDA